MSNSSRFSPVKLNIFSRSLTFALIISVLIFADSIFNLSLLHQLQFHYTHKTSSRHQLQLDHTHKTSSTQLKITREGVINYSLKPPSSTQLKITREGVINYTLKPQDLDLLSTSGLATRFDSRVRSFLGLNQCKIQVFMTWFSPADLFGEREFFGIESLFHTNPKSCLIILSKTMDSESGRKILDPLINLGFWVQAISPDLWALLQNTPGAEEWLIDIQNGIKDPGTYPLAQNLSNLIRLAALYQYGGVYLDTDFIVLKDISGLRNSIGAQSVDANGNWTRLNNALLVFDRRHFVVYKFIEEFALGFDGNTWGHNGPYLVSRVVSSLGKTGEYNLTILPPMAFYPFSFTRVRGFFVRHQDPVGAKWADLKTRQLNGISYAVHLWNKVSKEFKIEDGSVIDRLISAHCVTCTRNISSSS